MLKKDRLDQIIKLLQSKGVVEVSALCRIFRVTEMTVRRDLDELSEKGLIIRTHGGAILSEDNILVEQPYEARLLLNSEKKEAIAKAALDIIKDGQKIYLDSGTTTLALARAIDNTQRLVIITNAINIAMELNMRLNISVISIGGELRKNALSCTGHFAEDMIKKLRVDLAFTGVGGLGENGELYSGSIVEAGVKQLLMEISNQTVILADSSKIGHEDFVSFGNLKDIDYLITDSKAPAHILDKYREMGVQVIIADLD